ncbi:MAG: hypothetical protein IV103_20190 [Zoogloea sp.]|nr:hypothetical protein [Zoogloea sp.]
MTTSSIESNLPTLRRLLYPSWSENQACFRTTIAVLPAIQLHPVQRISENSSRVFVHVILEFISSELTPAVLIICATTNCRHPLMFSVGLSSSTFKPSNMTNLSHDSLTKQKIKDVLYFHLYDSVQQKFKKRLEALIIQNSKAISSPYLSFVYKSQVYACEGEKLPRRMNRLAPQLQPYMDEYLKDLKEINDREIPYVLGFINQVLNSSSDLHDYLKVLPSAVHPPIQKLIDSCPCRTKRLTDDMVQDLMIRNFSSIEMMKRRMVVNRLI